MQYLLTPFIKESHSIEAPEGLEHGFYLCEIFSHGQFLFRRLAEKVRTRCHQLGYWVWLLPRAV